MESYLPVSEEALEKMPLRALIALAARCARRVYPLFFVPEVDPSPIDGGELIAVDQVFIHAEGIVRGAYKIKEEILLSHTRNSIKVIDILAESAGSTVVAHTQIKTPHRVDALKSVASLGRCLDAVCGFAANAAVRFAVDAAKHSYAAEQLQIPGTGSFGVGDGDTVLSTAVDLAKLEELKLGSFPELGDTLEPGPQGPLGPLWAEGEPDWYIEASQEMHRFYEVYEEKYAAGEITKILGAPDHITSPPIIFVTWDPEALTEEEYTELVCLIGDVVRSAGGIGIERIRSKGIGVPVGEGVQI